MLWEDIRLKVKHEPIFEPVRDLLFLLPDRWPTCDDLNHAWNELHPSINLRFVTQIKINRKKTTDRSGSLQEYLSRIVDSGEVPTRQGSIHDLFNAFTFMIFPHSKISLFELHNQEFLKFMLDSDALKGGRGRSRLQDRLTMFDEGGAIEVDAKTTVVFGHGIFEQFMLKPIPIHAMTLKLPDGEDRYRPLKTIDKMTSQILRNPLNFENPKLFCGKQIPQGMSSC